MVKKIIKLIIKYPIMLLNRIYMLIYFKTNKAKLETKEIECTKNDKIMVLAPHVDDETIGLGGTLVKYSKQNIAMSLVYMTDGSGSTSDKSKEDTIKERMEEGHRIKVAYGFQNIYFLEQIDGQLDSNDAALLDKLENILNYEKPTVIFSPFLVDGNSDHIETTKALSKVLKQLNNKIANIFLYQVNTVIDPKIVNNISVLDRTIYNEKSDKYKIFESQWAMGFSIFNLLNKSRSWNYSMGYAIEVFVKLSALQLEQSISLFSEKKFNPNDYKQISSEFTLIKAMEKSKKEKQNYTELFNSLINN